MAGDFKDILTRLPADRRLDQAACEFLDKEIRKGSELNHLQRDGVLSLVQLCVEQNVLPPPPFESFFAYVYNEWSEEVKQSEAARPKLVELVKRLKANPPAANAVAQLAQKIVKEQQARRQAELARLAAALESGDGQKAAAKAGPAADPPNVMIRRMQTARHGGGENGMANLDLAAQYAEEAVEAYPNYPKVLFEAGGCHQMLAEKGTHLSLTDRYVHMRQAVTLYQQCLGMLAVQPYVNLKGEYDGWRKGLAEMLPKLQRKLEVLEEKAEVKP